jgi:hypothetical protein
MGEAGVRHVALYIGAHDDPSPMPALTRQALDRFAPVMERLRAR